MPCFEASAAKTHLLTMIERHISIIITIIIIITRPKPAYGRQGLAGSWGQDTDEVSTFLVFLTSHFAPAALSSDLNQPGTINEDKHRKNCECCPGHYLSTSVY